MSWEGSGIGWPVKRGDPKPDATDSLTYVFLDPGKCYEGVAVVVELFSPPDQRVKLVGSFGSDQTGAEHGYHCWRGVVFSREVQVGVRRKDELNAP